MHVSSERLPSTCGPSPPDTIGLAPPTDAAFQAVLEQARQAREPDAEAGWLAVVAMLPGLRVVDRPALPKTPSAAHEATAEPQATGDLQPQVAPPSATAPRAASPDPQGAEADSERPWPLPDWAADRTRFWHRAARAAATGDEADVFRLQVRPPELGRVQLEIRVDSHGVHACAEVESAAAAELLQRDLAQLRERLARHQLELKRFDVELRDDSSGGRSDRPPRRPSRRRLVPPRLGVAAARPAQPSHQRLDVLA